MDESSDGLPPDCKLIASLLRSCASLVSKQAPKQGESRYLRSILAVVAEAEKQESSALDGGRDDDNGPTFALIDGLAAARRARREDAALSCSSLVIDGSSEVKSAADIGALPQGAGEDGAAATSVQSMHEEPNMPSASEKVSEGSDKLSSLASKRTSQGTEPSSSSLLYAFPLALPLTLPIFRATARFERCGHTRGAWYREVARPQPRIIFHRRSGPSFKWCPRRRVQ